MIYSSQSSMPEQASSPPEPAPRSHDDRYADAMESIETGAPLSVWAGLLAEIITERGTTASWKISSKDPAMAAVELARQADANDLRRALMCRDVRTAGAILCRWYRQGAEEIAKQVADGDREAL